MTQDGDDFGERRSRIGRKVSLIRAGPAGMVCGAPILVRIGVELLSLQSNARVPGPAPGTGALAFCNGDKHWKPVAWLGVSSW